MAEDEAPRLLKALALSQRFHLYIAQCPSPRAADRLIHRIEHELPKLRGAPVQVVRLEPYAAQATDAPLTTELNERVLLPLLAPPAERRRHGTIHIVDASRATAHDDDTWARLFASWNEKRNLLQQLGGEVVVMLPRALSLVFATEAPDVWSIRSGEYEIGEPISEMAAQVTGRGVTADTVRTRSGSGGVDSSVAEVEEVEVEEEEEEELNAPSVAELAYMGSGNPLATWRMIPPLSMFGGDVVIAAWVPGSFRVHETRDIQQPPARALEGSYAVTAGRTLREAEIAIGDRRFADAERLLVGFADGVGADPTTRLRARVALAWSLAARDRPVEAWEHTENAQSIALAQPTRHARAEALAAATYVAWCRGHLSLSSRLDDQLEAEGAVSFGERLGSLADAQMLQAMERGDMTSAKNLAETLSRPVAARNVESRRQDSQMLAQRMVAADFSFLGHDTAAARRDVEDAAARADGTAAASTESLLARARPLATLLAAAQGDFEGAERVRRSTPSPRPAQPPSLAAEDAAVPRLAAFMAYAAGVVASERGEHGVALARFAEARRQIARWAAVGFDRRSLWRAHVATLLSACAVDPDPARAAGSAVEAQTRADALLGDTGEDHIARVLAVLARRTRRRHASVEMARVLALEAAELAAPLRIDGVERWSSLADACDRDAERATGTTGLA